MAPNKKSLALKKEMEKLKQKQLEQESDSDEIEQEEEDEEDFEDEHDQDAEDIEGEEEGDDIDDDEEEDDEDDDDEEDEDGDVIPKLIPSTERIKRKGDDDEEEEEEQQNQAREKLMMNQKGGQPDQAILNMKINDILHVLSKFKENNKEGRSRQSYLEELTDYLMQYYSYNRDLVQLFMTMFNPNELVQFFEANEAQRPLTIRTNTLKTRRKELAQILIQRGVNLDTLAEWTKVGLKIYDTKVPIGATPEYLAGHYMLQSASSFLPVIALAPQTNEKILDMAAAPGGKTTYIAQLMKNTGVLFANDVKADRNKALIFNVQRMGINNCIVTNYDGRKLPKVIHNCDRVLLDAPCTGLGIIARDPSVKANKQLIDVQKHAHLQRELILAAIDCCKKGGYVVYSTCSVTVQENESVVDFALKNRFVKLVDMGIDVGEEGYTKYQDKRFDPQLKKTRRILPHVHNMDGFYVAKLKKLENGPRTTKSETLNANLDIKGNDGELEEEQTLNTLKNNKVSMKQGAQGVVEVLANGEDFDFNDEEREKQEGISQQKSDLSKTILDKKEGKKRDEKKAQKEKVIQKQADNKIKNEKNNNQQIESGEKKMNKRERKLAAKAQYKLQQENNKEQQEAEEIQEEEQEDAVEQEQTEAVPEKKAKKDIKNKQQSAKAEQKSEKPKKNVEKEESADAQSAENNSEEPKEEKQAEKKDFKKKSFDNKKNNKFNNNNNKNNKFNGKKSHNNKFQNKGGKQDFQKKKFKSN